VETGAEIDRIDLQDDDNLMVQDIERGHMSEKS
jgi:hypothetical protein